MEVGRNPNKYQWYEQWAKIPITDSSVNGWAHNDMVVSKNGDIIGNFKVFVLGVVGWGK